MVQNGETIDSMGQFALADEDTELKYAGGAYSDVNYGSSNTGGGGGLTTSQVIAIIENKLTDATLNIGNIQVDAGGEVYVGGDRLLKAKEILLES